MSDTSLIQIKTDKQFKQRLKKVALEYDLPVSSFIKVVVGDFMRNKRSHLLTENSFTIEEENRIIQGIKETNKLIESKKINTVNAKDFITSLND